MALKIGLIGIVGEQLEQDVWGTMQQLREWGYDGLEGAASRAAKVGMAPEEFRDKMQEIGLAAAAQGGIGRDMSEDQVRESAATAASIGAKYIVDYYGPVESEQQLLRDAEYYDWVGRICREEGVRFCYHNHDHEFQLFDGRYALEILLENSDPENVNVELDVAWCSFGGANPVAVMTAYAGRCPVLHMKDFKELQPGCIHAHGGRKESMFTEVSEGVVNIQGVVRAAGSCGVEWLVVEQDRMGDLSPMDSARVSAKNLRHMVEELV